MISHNYVDRTGRQGVFFESRYVPSPSIPFSPRARNVPFYFPSRPNLRWLIIAVVLGAAVSAIPPFPVFAGEGDAGQGGRLYDRLCASCHRSLERSTVRGVSLPRIRSALRYVPSMRRLEMLTEQDISAITDAFKQARGDRKAKGG